MFIITGGGSGIGKALALELAKRDFEVLIIGRNIDKLRKVAELMPKINYLQADVASEEGRLQIKEHLADRKITALVNNAGIIQPIIEIADITLKDWHHVMATNLDAPLFLTKLLRTNLHAGRVLNIGSGAAHFSIYGWAAYCVSKAALLRLTECLQLEENNISFATVKPGIIDTDMQAEIRASSHMLQAKQEFFKKLYSEQRLIKPEVVACFLAWLLIDLDVIKYQSQEWDIYDTEHHKFWLKKGNHVPLI